MTALATAPAVQHPSAAVPARPRFASIDASRGFTMFAMIFVNNLAGMSVVPAWMQHHDPKVSGMTFVDMVFPAFIFIAGLSIPFALGSRLNKGESPWRVFGHVVIRVLSLLLIGVMMVNGLPDSDRLGWSKFAWQTFMYMAAFAAFCSFTPARRNLRESTQRKLNLTQLCVRMIGFIALVYLAFAYRGPHDERIIRLSPFYISTSWWGILGAIGWAYLVAAAVFLLFRANQTAVLACVVLLTGLYYADEAKAFAHFAPAHYVSFGKAIGTHGMLCTAGLLLGLMLVSPETRSIAHRVKFTLWFIAGFSAAALLLVSPFGISKNAATPAWACWGCAITAALWLTFYLLGDVLHFQLITRPLAAAGQNVLLAYLLSQILLPLLRVIGLYHAYVRVAPDLASAIARASVTAVLILLLAHGLNRAGFRLKL